MKTKILLFSCLMMLSLALRAEDRVWQLGDSSQITARFSQGVLRISGTGAITFQPGAPEDGATFIPWTDAGLNDSIISIIIEEGITTVPYGLFGYLNHLQKADLNAEYLAEASFMRCSHMEELILRDKIKKIEQYAFSECPQLHKIYTYLPEDVEMDYRAWANTSNIDTIFAYSPFAFGTYTYTENVVVVPASKEIAKSWESYGYIIEQHDESFDHIIMGPYTINAANAQSLNQSSMILDFSIRDTSKIAQMTVDSGVTVSFTRFAKNDYISGEPTWKQWNEEMKYFSEDPQINYYPGYSPVQTAMINHGTITADQVLLRSKIELNSWWFTSLPFNQKVADIQVGTGIYTAIRHFDPTQVANGNDNDAWVNYKATDTIPANTAFILQAGDPDWNANKAELEFSALDDSKKNNIFVSGDQSLALTKTEAEQSWNANWNLLANPFPSFYNAREMASNGVIGVYLGGMKDRSGGYTFFSLRDDYYVLQPFEAFFYQAKENENTLSIPAAGRRMTARPDQVTDPDPRARVASRNSRTLYDIILSGDDYSDHCRIVINDDAEYEYETGVDAPKMAMGTEPILLSSTMNDTRLAINERPMGDGRIALNVVLNEAGSYTFHLDNAQDITLTDTQTNITTDLSESDYTFTAQAGDYANRFIFQIADRLTSCENVRSDSETAIYNLQGIRMNKANEMPVGIYIIRQGDKVVKSLIK